MIQGVIEIGQTYQVDHARKGQFKLKVTGVSWPWVTGEVMQGRAGAIRPENARRAGETLTFDASHATLDKITAPAPGDIDF